MKINYLMDDALTFINCVISLYTLTISIVHLIRFPRVRSLIDIKHMLIMLNVMHNQMLPKSSKVQLIILVEI